jgi:hypothetical protein
MTLFEMFSLIKLITNKDFSGSIITPEKFQLLLPIVQLDWFRNKYGLPEEYQPGKPVPREYVEITLKSTDDLKAFHEFVPNIQLVNGLLPFSTDYLHRDEIVFNFTIKINKKDTVLPRGVEILRESQLATRLGNYTKRPTLRMPVGVVRQAGIQIYPWEVSELNPEPIRAVDFSYWRYPRNPVFRYFMNDGFITYDAANSIELEAPSDEHIVILRMLLSYIGVSLRESDIVQYTETKLKEG